MEDLEYVTFELSKTFEYTNQTEVVECTFIELRAPTGKQTHTILQVQAIIQAGIMGMAANLTEKEKAEAMEASAQGKADAGDDKMLPDQFEASMMMCGDDISKLSLLFRDLFKAYGYMQGEKLLSVARLDDITPKDFKKMMGVYGANFIMT